MLKDARSLWMSASSMISTLNEKVSNAILEGMESDMADETDGSRETPVAEIDSVDGHSAAAITLDDLETYKRMLDEAHIQHVELSKHSRMLLAEKEVELEMYRKKLGETVGESDTSSCDGDTNVPQMEIQIAMLKAANHVLETDLQELQTQLRVSSREVNEAKFKGRRIEELDELLIEVRKEISELRAGDRQKSETIDDLVEEYSKLAAESELRHTKDSTRIQEITNENEILVTKLHALEHNISELADRQVNAPLTASPSVQTSKSIENSHPNLLQFDLQQQAAAASATELKDLKAKLTTAFFEMREKDLELQRLKAALSKSSSTAVDLSATSPFSSPMKLRVQSISSSSTIEPALSVEPHAKSDAITSAVEAAKQRLLEQIDCLKLDISRLQIERDEANAVGRQYWEEIKTLRANCNNQSAAESVDSTEQTEKIKKMLSDALRELDAERSNTKTLLSERDAKISELLYTSSSRLAEIDSISHAARTEAQLLRETIAQLENNLRETKAKEESLRQDTLSLTASESTRLESVTRLDTLEDEIGRLRSELSKSEVECESLRRSRSELSETATCLRNESAELKSAKDSIEKAYKELEIQHASLKDTLREKSDEIDKFKIEHESAVSALKEEHAAKLSSSDGEREAALRDLKARLIPLKAEMESLHRELSESKVECESLRKSSAESSDAVVGWMKSYDELKCEKNSIDDARSELEAQNLNLQGQLMERISEVAKCRTDHEAILSALKEEYAASLCSSEEERAAALRSLEAKLAEAYRTEREALQREVERLTHEVKALSADSSSAVSVLAEAAAASRAEHARELSVLAEQKGAEVEALRASFEESERKKTGELVEAHARELCALKEEMTAEMNILRNSLAESEKTFQEAVDSHQREISVLTDQKVAEVNDLQISLTQTQKSFSEASEQHRKELSILAEQRIAETNKLTDSLAQSERMFEEAAIGHQKEMEELLASHTVELGSLKNELSTSIDALKASEAHLAESSRAYEIQLAEAARNADARLDDALRSAEAQLTAAVDAEKDAACAQLASVLKDAEDKLSEVQKNAEIRLSDAVSSERDASEARLADASRIAESRLSEAVEAEKAAGEAHLQRQREASMAELAEERRRSAQAVASVETERDGLRAELSVSESKCEARVRDAVKAAEVAKDAEKEREVALLREEYKSSIDSARQERDEYLALYTKENKARKAVHNKLLELQGNIRVFCRVRPVLEVERRSGEDVDVTSFPSDEDINILRDPNGTARSKFEYDRVFKPTSTQDEVFEAVQPLCVSVLDGYNVCIFAYGQTGSGKTFTMEGYGDQIGVSPRAVGEVFRIVRGLEDEWSYTLTFSMLEIYNETIRDLLVTDGPTSNSSKDREKLDVRQTPEGNTVPGLTEIQVHDTDQVTQLLERAKTNRAVGSHDMNEHSSRSHSILTIVCRGRNKRDGSATFGKLNLIDLAGSERISKTDATGDRLKEAQNINRSLSALGDVINALGNKKASHVPYRNSKLTFLLQDSLGGNSKVMMFVNVSPAVYNVGETICSLNFASRCRSIELGQAKKQQSSSDSTSSSSVSASSSLPSAAGLFSTPSATRRSSIAGGGVTGSLSSALKR